MTTCLEVISKHHALLRNINRPMALAMFTTAIISDPKSAIAQSCFKAAKFRRLNQTDGLVRLFCNANQTLTNTCKMGASLIPCLA